MNVIEAMMEKGQDSRWGVLDDGTVNYGYLRLIKRFYWHNDILQNVTFLREK
jgi:hypothetical protein